MLTRLAMPLILCAAALAAAAHAAPLPVPTVAYSADRLIESEAGTMTGKVYATRGMERQETTMSGMTTVMILRHDRELGYMLMPSQHMYSQLDLATAQKQSGSQAPDLVEITKVGSETIEGHSTTQYKMMMKDGSGGGFIWITSDGIPIKMDMLSKSDGTKTRMTLTLTNLKIGAQDPQLFEVPSGYTAMPKFGGAAGVGGFMGGRAGAGNTSAPSPSGDAAPNASGNPTAANAPGDNATPPEQPSVTGTAASSGLSTLGNAARGLFHRH